MMLLLSHCNRLGERAVHPTPVVLEIHPDRLLTRLRLLARRAKLSKHPLSKGLTLDSLKAQAAMMEYKYGARKGGKQSPFKGFTPPKHAGADREAEFGILPIDNDASAWYAEAKKGHGVPLTGQWPVWHRMLWYSLVLTLVFAQTS